MATTTIKTKSVSLQSGSLELEVESGPHIEGLCGFASRANPKRGFLIVSKILGRHLPARPAAMRQSMQQLASMISADLPQPILFLGMAETATGLGQGTFAAFCERNPGAQALYLQTSRQKVAGAEIVASFEEGHSHATTHLVQISNQRDHQTAQDARSLVIIDDECSTGKTFISAAEALQHAFPAIEKAETCCITDWSAKGYLDNLPLPAKGHAILNGSMTWTPDPTAAVHALPAGANKAGQAPQTGMKSRTGLTRPEKADRGPLTAHPGERILVLGEGEHAYEALLIAEELEQKGAIAAVQSITRSPALLGGAMRSISSFSDVYGSQAPCFLYNILGHRPDRIIIATEIAANQAAEAHTALAKLGSNIPVEVIECIYDSKKGAL